jgi:tungstate transport system substrate-binding protein
MHRIIQHLFALLIFIPSVLNAGETIKCASTTTTRDSGILDYLLPIFKQAMGIDVQVIAVDTDAALKLGQEGKVDVVLTSDEDLEKLLVDEGFFIDREDIMYNDFVLLGPANDPAEVIDSKTVVDGFKKVRAMGAGFISRGDNSDTNMRENRIWAMTGRMPERSNSWYMVANQGMAGTIRIATEKKAYTLTDRATWYSMEDKEKPTLTLVLEGDPTLFNQYGVMIVNPKNHKHVNYQSAMNFVIWLSSSPGQKAIAAFRDASGNVLFTPNAR